MSSLSAAARREVLRQIDRDLDTRYGLDRVIETHDQEHEPSPTWLAMEGVTECPVCGGPISPARDCPKGCLDEWHCELLGVGDDVAPTGRDHRGWLRS